MLELLKNELAKIHSREIRWEIFVMYLIAIALGAIAESISELGRSK